MAAQAPQRPFRAPHLRQVSTGSSGLVGDSPAYTAGESQAETSTSATQQSRNFAPQSLVLSIHDEHFSKEDVVLNHSPNRNVHEGDLLQLTPANGSPPEHKSINGNADPNKRLSFLFKPPLQELLLEQPALQVSISQRVAVAFGFEKGIQVIVSTADKHACHATHVEIVFRDQYLARADMWHIVAQELADTCIYRGQKIEFMGSIRAHIKTIFAHGKKVQSAFFHQFTKPIFRSESARYVLFIQMSKEMWDFDAEGTGEIMFDKVINGFLPELFQRWRDLKVKHLVSIVLFTRMVYEGHTSQDLAKPTLDSAHNQRPRIGEENMSKDFYRVVVSDLASAEWADILNQLKKEFKVFLKDISIRKPVAGDHLPLGEGLSSALADTPSHVIAGHPSAATGGNVLEAINLASSQFSSDYIDRDLVRTGVSVVVISPGAGVFEVDYNLLVATTDNLIENGVGIDLVCLSRMPLHSVPLFKYHPPAVLPVNTLLAGTFKIGEDEKTPTGSFVSQSSPETPPTTFASGKMEHQRGTYLESSRKEKWSYGVPHWIDVSFWAPPSDPGSSQVVTTGKVKNKSSFDTPQHKTFVPRVKMYELQMMGVMENENNDIIVPRLTQISRLLATATSHANSTTVRGVPKLDSKMSVSDSLGAQSHGLLDRTHKLSTSVTSDRSIINLKSILPQFQWMDDYDDLVYRHPLVVKKRAHKVKIGKAASRNRQQHRYSPSLLGTSGDKCQKSLLRDMHSSDDGSYLSREPLKHQALQVKQSKHAKTDDASFGKQTPRPQANKGTRQISFGPRGFPAKAVPSTEVTTKYEVGSLLSRGFKSGFTPKSAGLSNATTRKDPASKRSVSPNLKGSNTERQSSGSESPQSRPIPIRNATAIRVTGDGEARLKLHGRDSHALDSGVKLQNRLAALQDLQEREGDISMPELDAVNDVLPPPIALSPSTTLAPWLTLLNPSNPSKTKTALASRLGRWQHIFPRPLKTSQIKWKSLCSPAAVPLTTEDFPSAEQLAEEYEGTTYDIDLPETSLSETAWSLATEILAFRLSRGFQMVIGPRVAESTKMPSMQTLTVFDERILTDTGSSIFLTRGSTIHRVSRVEANKIEVKELFRHGGEIVRDSVPGSMLYKPLIRSILADEYEVQEISIAPHRSNFDWKTIDSFIIGHERPQAADFVDNLRPWRARFVLIPVEAPSSARRRVRAGEDDEEEIRLEGIRKLTQVWQRFRYIPPDERRYQAPLRNRKDTNPLDILYQTRNPSAIVAAELENVAEGDATGGQEQLLPDSDLYQRSNYKIAPLAETIQSEKGVRMLDRRWHLRLHYNCFIGFELTNWLLQNFRDVDTREEAVELGNELMTSGMFKHVEQRHNFRDGNYFYQIADEYRTPRPESRGWFGRGKASVPSTPMSEDLPKQLNITGRSRSSSKSNPTKDSEPSTPTGKKKQLGVALSKSLIYDVDHRKRSYRPELVNLHYDRLHNPDNCYHIRVDWMNTTPKLIQDAVVSWATSVDRFGLRLVELPLAEASSITSMHPFRAPHLVKLAQPPPEKQPQSYFDSTSLGPQPRTERNFYQKAIMKRFNFVLDLEAASDFPADVDVTYSWGKPDYRYPQYIHRSGMLIAQITDDGHFLLLANRLYNNRNARPPSYQDSNRADHPSDSDQSRGPGFFRSSPHRGTHAAHHPSPLHSPYSSPSVHATLHVPQNIPHSQNEPQRSTPTSAASFPKHIDPTRPSPTASSTPDATKQDFEAFCNNPEALSLFYDEVLSKASTPGPNTPFMGGKTPSKVSDTGVESAIPTLALPGRLVDRSEEGSGKKADARARAVGGGSPGVGGRKGGDNG